MAFDRDIGSLIKLETGIIPEDSDAATINGPSINRLGFGSAVLHHSAGAASGSPTGQVVASKLQDSADESVWADLTGAAPSDLIADDKDSEVDVDLKGAREFIRTVMAVSFTAGTSPAIPVSATIVLGAAQTLPA